MVEGHEEDLNTACRKAARQLGVSDSRLWPDKDMLAASLAEYRAVFLPSHPGDHQQRLQTALAFMQTIAEIDPLMVGDSVSGLSGPNAATELAVDMEFEKQLVFYLTNHGLPYRYLPGKQVIMEVDVGDATYLISLKPGPAMRQLRHENPTDGQPISLSIRQLEDLLAAENPSLTTP